MIYNRNLLTRRFTNACFWLVTAAVSSGCSGTDQRAGGAHARESNIPAPAVVIGTADGPAHQLDRVYAGLVRGDGSILIGNSGSAELRLFDGRGVHRLSAGREGSGPGEFRSINWMQPYRGDSVLVFDMRTQRFSVWSPAGSFGRTFRAETSSGAARPIGVFSDGTILIALEGQYDPRRGPGTVRDTTTLLRASSEGRILRELGTFAGAEWLVYPHPASFRATQLPFGRQGHVAVAGDHFVYGSSDADRLLVHDTTGRLVRTLTVPVSARQPSIDEIRTELAAITDPVENRALTRYFDANRANVRATAISDLRGGRDVNLWMRTTNPAASGAALWHVLGLSGERRKQVALPAGAVPLDLGPNGALMRETDDDGVQRVALRPVAQ